MDKFAAPFTLCDAVAVGTIFLAGAEREKGNGQGKGPENQFVPLNAHSGLPFWLVAGERERGCGKWISVISIVRVRIASLAPLARRERGCRLIELQWLTWRSSVAFVVVKRHHLRLPCRGWGGGPVPRV